MLPFSIDQQVHGYRSGHQLIAASRRLPRQDQDLIDRLSDTAGQLRPGEKFKPYLTAYPLPSGNDYVVARTWQDLEAPRSGCVRTRSLIIAMAQWLSMDGIRSLLPLLVPAKFDEKLAALEPADPAAPTRKVFEPRRTELVEALFFEPRQPIVVFDSADAEPIVERLLAAFWPALKQSFSVCTYALAPRKIEGKLFDLTFAPKGARARFSDWTGRRVENSSTSDRHPWSILIAKKIFDADNPDLRTIDTLGALRSDRKGDEGTLRLSLMWNDLAERSRTAPSAVLGMLDILNSRTWPEFDRRRLRKIVQQATEIAVAEPDEDDGLRFLSTLAAKVTNFDVEMLDDLDLSGLARALTSRSPRRAVSFLRSQVDAHRNLAMPIIKGLADGLGEEPFDDETSESLLRLPREVSSMMIVQSEKYGRQVWRQCAANGSRWVAPTRAAVTSMSRHDRVELLRKMPSWMTHEAQAPIMEAALEGTTADDLADFAVAIGKVTGFEVAAFDEPIANTAKNTESLNALRTSVLHNFHNEGADRFLLSTLELSLADLAWLGGGVEKTRALGLLRRLLDRSSPRALVSVQLDPESRDRVLELLTLDVAGSAAQLIRFVGSSDLPIDRYMDIARAVLPYLLTGQRDAFVLKLLERALAEADPSDAFVPLVIEESVGVVSSRRLVRLATADGASTKRVAANLILFGASSQLVRRSISEAIEDLCERLISRYGENLGEAAYNAWATLLLGARDHLPDVQLRASLRTLPFAMAKRDLPVSALIGAVFPPVYAELLRSTGDEDFQRLPALLALPLSIFTNWDRAKSARHELVDAYLYSSWPPADLLLTSLAAGIQIETLRRLTKSHRGREYLDAIDTDSHRLEHAQSHRIQECLARLDRL